MYFGTNKNIKKEVENNMIIFGKKEVPVFNIVHNVQATVSIDSPVTMFEIVRGKVLVII